MTRTARAPHVRPLPRFTFAGRGCRDPRREPRRQPAVQRTAPVPVGDATSGTVPGHGGLQRAVGV
jgi:hypothetical protein